MAVPDGIFSRRRAGMLLHPTSLPGPSAAGTLGDEARRFVEFLAGAGFSVWQMLPVGPVNASRSPYQTFSVFAGDPALLPPTAGAGPPWESRRGDFERFRQEQAYWLEDYVLYSALKRRFHGLAWYCWPTELRGREAGALRQAAGELDGELQRQRHLQFEFFDTWQRLKAHANAAGVQLFGDIPMFAAHDSADVWAHPEFFELGADGTMQEVAGVPPDAFAEEGQYWGMPQYCWPRLAADGYRWWIERLRLQSSLYDLLRLDHFRGFEASWSIPGTARSAAAGRWLPGPGGLLLDALAKALGPLPFVAEDLGVITPPVHKLMQDWDLPGMHVLQFAFSGDPHNPHLPHNHRRHGVVYTGTHDNNTTLGWWRTLDDTCSRQVLEYLDFPREEMPWPLVHSALESVCALAVLPLQDCLALGAEARMNTPGREADNWHWRCPAGALDDRLREELAGLVRLYSRDV